MKKSNLIFVIILLVALTVILSGCGREEQSLDGLYIATFELAGGTLETPTSSVDKNINFAYHPGTYVLDPVSLNGYKIMKLGYDFTGWYTDPACTPESKWDFTSVIDTEHITLYAGWRESIYFTYNVCYVDKDGKTQILGTYDVQPGDVFNDTKGYNNNRGGFTALEGYYSDLNCTVAWDDSFTHPGGESSVAINVFVKHIEGVWALVDTKEEFANAIAGGQNVQLMADIDFGGDVLDLGEYDGVIAGNNHTVSNFTVKCDISVSQYTHKSKVTCAIFDNLANGAEISDISFTGVKYDLTGLSDVSDISSFELAALSLNCNGKGNISVIISNVTIEGTIVTDYQGDIPAVSEFIYSVSDKADVEVTDSSFTFTVSKVN